MPAASPPIFYQFTDRVRRGALASRKLEARKFHPEIRLAHVSTGLVKVPREVFDFCLVYFFSATGICQVNGVDFPFTPRTLLLQPPFQPSHFDLEAEMSTRHVAVHFDICEGFPDRQPIHLRKPYQVDLQPELRIPVATIFPSDYPLSQNLLQLVDDWQRQDTVGKLRANAMLSQILLEGCRFAQSDDAPGKFSRVHESIISAMSYMEEHFSESLSPDMISDAVGYSSNYLSRMFRKEYGTSVMEFLTKMRMQHAVELLKDPRHSVKEIAPMLGYQNARHFCRTFKEQRGVTPTQWRRAHSLPDGARRNS